MADIRPSAYAKSKHHFYLNKTLITSLHLIMPSYKVIKEHKSVIIGILKRYINVRGEIGKWLGSS